MEALVYSILATLVVSAISFVGIVLFFKNVSEKSNFITSLVAFAAGALLGDAFLHMLSEHIETYGFEIKTMFFVFGGILLMLLVEAYFHCSHETQEEHAEHEHKKGVLAKINTIGDGFHNFLDGIAIGASFLISPVAGVASTLAIIFHEIPQELADVGILLHSGWDKKKILVVNFLTALTAVAGAILTVLIGNIAENSSKYLIPLAAGQFIYIALADLLPEIHHKSGIKKYTLEIAMFVAGFVIMYLLLSLE